MLVFVLITLKNVVLIIRGNFKINYSTKIPGSIPSTFPQKGTVKGKRVFQTQNKRETSKRGTPKLLVLLSTNTRKKIKLVARPNYFKIQLVEQAIASDKTCIEDPGDTDFTTDSTSYANIEPASYSIACQDVALTRERSTQYKDLSMKNTGSQTAFIGVDAQTQTPDWVSTVATRSTSCQVELEEGSGNYTQLDILCAFIICK